MSANPPPRSRLIATAALVLGLAGSACTLLFDHDAHQCTVDADCAKFPGHPLCQGNLCVSSGLGPPDCFFGNPMTPDQFANQCSPAQCKAFDNCARLNLCNGASDADAGLTAPPKPDAGTTATDGGTASADAGTPSLPSCLDPTNGRTQAVYVTGSSNFPPLFSKLAPLIIANGFTPVYQVTSSCNGVKTMFGTGARDHLMLDPAPGSTTQPAAYYNMDGTSVPCSLGAGGVQVDIGESDIFSSSCSGFGTPSNQVGEFLGPIQAMMFVVPGNSQQTTISEEAARDVFGRGGDNGVAVPWTNPSLYFIRNSNTGTQQMIGRAIGVPADQFWGVDRSSAKNVDALLAVVTEAAPADQAIGIISSDFADGDRGNIRTLAFKATGQECAYLPDSRDGHFDKRNVRDGHYPIWGPLHFFANVSSGVPITTAAQNFVQVVSVPNLQQSLLDAFIASRLVPSCAMRVNRTSELGALASFAPTFMCGCYFESMADLKGATPDGCTRCVTSEDCANNDPAHPTCNLGFCELQ